MRDQKNVLTTVPAAKAEDDDTPRLPPPPATPLDFPCCEPLAKEPQDLREPHSLVNLFSNILRTGPSLKHLEALNVNLVSNVPLDDLLPGTYLPALSWLEDPAKIHDASTSPPTTPFKETLSDGGPSPSHEAFFTRVRELLYDNEDAFRVVQRKLSRSNHPALRVVHFRKFWDNLALMAEYWDTSLDRYSKAAGESGTSAIDSNEPLSDAQAITELEVPKDSTAAAEETYTGRRKDTGRNMPGKYREDAVFNFVEPLAWSFRCRLEHARMQPKLKMQGMVLPLPHNGNIYRPSKDIRQAKRGSVEGPMVGVFCRDQVNFRRSEDKVSEGKQEILDLLREVGLMLMLAQKRAREGKHEQKPGEDQWWATKPRWGGGPGGELGISAEEENVEETPTPEGPRKRSKKMNRAELWRNVRPPAPTWEVGITYKRIGYMPGSEFDDVTYTSSLLVVRAANDVLDLPHLVRQPPYLYHPSSDP